MRNIHQFKKATYFIMTLSIGYLFTTSCLQKDTVSEEVAAPTASTESSRRSAMNTIMTKYCVSCHSSAPNSQAPDLSAQSRIAWEALDPDTFLSGRPDTSSLFLSLQNNGVGGNAKMPKNAAALSSAEIATIKDFILKFSDE